MWNSEGGHIRCDARPPRSPRRPSALLALVLLGCAGCLGRYVRISEKGLTCVEAHSVAIDAVRRMGYTISEATKATPGAPGVILAARQVGTNKQSIFVQVFCTTQGAEVEAKSDQGGLEQLSFGNEFRRTFEVAAANQAPPRAAAESGVDVLLSPDRGGATDLGVDLTGLGILPISVRITNRTPRTYGFRVKDVLLQTASGERVHAEPVSEVAKRVDATAAEKLRAKVLGDHTIAADETLTGVLLFPFNAYSGARVELIDRASGEAEGFAIEF